MSVRLFVTRQYSVETAQYIIKLFSPSGSYTALVFVVPNVVAIFRQGPLTGASGMKTSRFLANIWLYLGNDTRYGHVYYGMRIEDRTGT